MAGNWLRQPCANDGVLCAQTRINLLAAKHPNW